MMRGMSQSENNPTEEQNESDITNISSPELENTVAGYLLQHARKILTYHFANHYQFKAKIFQNH